MLKVKKLDPRAILPTMAHDGDLAYDLYALEDTVLKFGIVTKVQTGIAAQAFEKTRTLHKTGFDDPYIAPSEVIRVRLSPLGLLIRDRSSMASKGLVVSGGVIDHGYTGEISVLMTNQQRNPIGTDPAYNVLVSYHIKAGDKIAQMIPMPLLTGEVVEVEELVESSRGADGFGSTGK